MKANTGNATYQGFVEFCNNQPADRPIDDDSWWSCSVGDYIETVKGYSTNAVEMGEDLESAEDFCDGFDMQKYIESSPKMQQTTHFANHCLPQDVFWLLGGCYSTEECDTYGKLCSLLDDLGN